MSNLVPIHSPDEGRAPWERENLRPLVASSEDKKTDKVDARVTPGMSRALTKLIQQRILPELENKSDVVVAGLHMVLHYARLHGTESEDFAKTVDMMAWEQEVLWRERYFDRMSSLLDRIETQLQLTKEKGRDQTFIAVYADLAKNKKRIEDEGLLTRANRMFVFYAGHASDLKKQA